METFIAQTVVTPAQLREHIDSLANAGVTNILGFAGEGAGWATAMRSFAKAVGI